MTSTTGNDSHPEAMEISDLAEGVLLPDRAAQVRSHIESCELCSDVLASIQEISSLLGELPPPGPMPADVAHRIDAALATEALLDSTLPRVPRETSPSQPGAASVPRGTSAPAGHPSAPTGPGRATRRWRRALLIGAASAAGVLALGGVIYELASHTGPSSMGADSAKRNSSAQDGGGVNAVADQVAQLLHGPTGKAHGGATSPLLSNKGHTAVAAPNGTTTSVPKCVLQATHRSQPPLAAQREQFQGTDSYLVVLPDPADSTVVDAFVVTASCTATSPGNVLFQDSYPRD
jgi:hypothetical protein